MKTPDSANHFSRYGRRYLLGGAVALVLLALAAPLALPAIAERLAGSPVAWQTRRTVYGADTYSAAPAIAALSQDGRAYLAWEERDYEADNDDMLAIHNNTLGGGFDDEQALDTSRAELLGNTVAVHDSLGRVHLAWFHQDNGGVVIRYARSNPEGTAWERNGAIEVTRSSNSEPRKNVAMAIGPGNIVHMLYGRHEVDLRYIFSTDGIDWADNVPLPTRDMPKEASIAVSTGGVIMAAWVDRGYGDPDGDVMVSTRNANGTWAGVTNISAPVGNRANTYWPRLAADHTGGIRAVWADEDIHVIPPGEPRGRTDIYYREWSPTSGWSALLHRLVANSGEALQPTIRVDSTNAAHIVWMDDTGRPRGNYILLYTVGDNAGFVPAGPVDTSLGEAYMKDPVLDWTNNVLHLGFVSNISDPDRDVFYNWGNTQSPATPTPTNTPQPTNTPRPTPTLAPCTFYDVNTTDYFYEPVRYLCARNAISGYADGTFRPFNNTTRGQLSKIVVVAEGWAINTTGGPHFADVPTSNTFYGWIETAFRRGIISGYACGGPGEPCGPGNRPYFRWGNNVTRGQLSKIIVEAEDWPINTTGGPHFADVPTSNTFYGWIETAFRRGIISGYACGGPGEPCGPGNRPYFRWGNTATRGQISKIVHGAVTAP